MSLPNDEDFRMEILSGRRGRTLAFYLDGGGVISATVSKEIWRVLVPIALRHAPVHLRRLARKPTPPPPAAAPLPVCADTLSLLRLLKFAEGLDLHTAERIAEGWMQMPAPDREKGRFACLCRRAVHVQLLGLIEPASPAIADRSPELFQDFIKATQYARPSNVSGLYWRTADTVLGSTSIAFVSPLTYQREAYLVVSNCKVSYPLIGGGARSAAHWAVQALIDHLPTVVADEDALRLAGWHPTGHELMELGEYLEHLKVRIGRQNGSSIAGENL